MVTHKISTNKEDRDTLNAFVWTTWSQYFYEYEKATKILIESIKNKQSEILPLPLLFLIRHSIELGLKANIIELEEEICIKKTPQETIFKSHSLEDLYHRFYKVIKKYNLNEREKEEYIEKSCNNLCTVIEKIHRWDKKSTAFRYPTDNRTGNKHFGYGKIDLVEIDNLCESILFLYDVKTLLHTIMMDNKDERRSKIEKQNTAKVFNSYSKRLKEIRNKKSGGK